MPEDHARERLRHFLDERVFDPVLNVPPERYESERDRETLRDVQGATRSTKERYLRSYGSAREIVERFEDDLSAEAAKKVHRQLRDLGLPTLNDVRDHFERLADQLDVGH
ncbi:MAG: hypothetical protein IRY97_04190 [Thermomicrobiaceae bacterium]|nr:hypothetical protein [Thermomicrobiaceae bacterium]